MLTRMPRPEPADTPREGCCPIAMCVLCEDLMPGTSLLPRLPFLKRPQPPGGTPGKACPL